MNISANPFSRSSLMVERRYVFNSLRALNDRSAVAEDIGRVTKICNNILMFSHIEESQDCNASATVDSLSLGADLGHFNCLLKNSDSSTEIPPSKNDP